MIFKRKYQLHLLNVRIHRFSALVLVVMIITALCGMYHLSVNHYQTCSEIEFNDVAPPVAVRISNFTATSNKIWSGQATETDFRDPHNFPISVVLSHCLGNLAWLPRYLSDFEVRNVTIVSKCGVQPNTEQLPPATKIIEIENVGRIDHTIAHWITEVLTVANKVVKEKDDEIVVFMKDNIMVHTFAKLRSFAELLNITSSNGFACALEPKGRSFFHLTDVLTHFRLNSYRGAVGNRNRPKHDYKDVVFKSKYDGMAEWLRDMEISLPRPLTPVCYGGIFAVKLSQILKVPHHIWNNIRNSLVRGDNIEEGHFAERTWAGLLHPRLMNFEMDFLIAMSRDVCYEYGNMRGALKL